MKWATLTDAQHRKWCDWIVGTCLLHGSTLYTAYSVAALFGGGLDRDSQVSGRSERIPDVPAGSE